MSDTRKRIAARLREAREKMKLRQCDVAKMTGVSQSTIYNIEIAITDPLFSTVIKMADLYGISLDEFREKE